MAGEKTDIYASQRATLLGAHLQHFVPIIVCRVSPQHKASRSKDADLQTYILHALEDVRVRMPFARPLLQKPAFFVYTPHFQQARTDTPLRAGAQPGLFQNLSASEVGRGPAENACIIS